jgi:Golgi nucleoside diphosphatase
MKKVDLVGLLIIIYKKLLVQKKDKTLSISPYTVIEMGGASAQVSQLAPNAKEANLIPPEYRFSFNIEDDEYHLYTHSYLGYGAEQAREQFTRLLAKASSSTLNTTATTTAASGSSDPCRHTGMISTSKSRRGLRYHHHHHRYEHRMLQAQEVDNANNTAAAAASTTSSTNELITAVTRQCTQSVAALFSPVSTAMNTLLNSSGLSTTIAKNRCSSSGPFSFNCVYQPAFVTESTNILAFENFYYLSSALGVSPVDMLNTENHKNEENNKTAVSTKVKVGFPLKTTAKHVKEAADRFCALEWSAVNMQYPKDNQGKEVNGKMCFIASFAYAFLVDGLKIPVDKVLTIQKEVGDSEIEWALGAAYKEAAAFLKRSNLRPT